MKFDLINGDCIEEMSKLPEGSIDLTVTSPPYDNLRTYNGNITQWNEDKWKNVIKQLYRITKQSGVVVWVVNDSTINGSETGTSFKQALYAMQCGFNLHDTMIYMKNNFSNPSSNRYHQIFEYMFIFSKGKPKTFNPLKDRKNVYAGQIGSWGKNTSRQQDGSMVERKKKIIEENGKRYNIWKYKTSKNGQEDNIAYQHPAIFPEKLAHDHIISWSNEGDIVLDCFMGSGTTGVACKKTNRNFIGIELDKTYFDISTKRINNIQSNLL
jgi:site-specific DNA-methyltransferase (adenine-specific)